MIKNEHQYRITRKLARELLDAVDMLPTDKEYLAMKGLEQKAYASSLRRQLQQLQNELEEFDLLKAGEFDFSQADAIKNVSSLLIKMRIARGIKQEDLAKRLKLKKQQIQQYEATDYSTASLARVLQILAVLSEEQKTDSGARTPVSKAKQTRSAATTRGKKRA